MATGKKKKADRKQTMVRILCFVIAGIFVLSTVIAALYGNLF